jgi:hypothetical protein
MKSITTAQRRQIESVRDRYLRQTEQDRAQDEVRYAKVFQQQTGCTWTEALRAAYRRAA